MDRNDTERDKDPRAPRPAIDAAGLYGLYYFGHGCGRPYVRDEGWLSFFGKIAERIVSEINPGSVLDAGCAMGFLVEGLRGRGVDAMGLDISEYAIARAHETIRPFCRVGSVTDPLPRRYDLIVCIEVLEHLPAREAERAVENLCGATDEVLFSSTPVDYKEATHFNVQQPEYWAELFARCGLYRDLDFDASFITPWAALYRRRKWSPPRLVAGYERRLWNLMKEVQGCREVALEQRVQLGAAEATAQYQASRISELAEVARQQAETERRLMEDASGLYRSLEGARAEHAETARALARERAEHAETARALARERAEHAAAVQALERERAERANLIAAASARADAATEEARRLAAQLGETREALAAMSTSGAWAMARTASRFQSAIAPNNSRRHRALRVAVQAARVWRHEGAGAFARKSGRRLLGRCPAPTPSAAPPSVPDRIAARARAEGEYADWIARREPDAQAHKAQAARSLAYRPLISVLTPVYNTHGHILEATIRSVVEQTYDHWELCLVDGGSDEPTTRSTLDAWAARDPRVRLRRLDQNRGIAGNSNVALGMARGEYVALLDHDDLLAPSALYEVARRIEADPALDFLYSDKDRISEDGLRRFCPFFKPGWSPEIMLSANYLTHLNVIRTALALRVGGFRAETEGAQDWDLFLRVLEQTERIAHIPAVLYHWRVWSQSVASGMTAKPYAYESQRRTLEEHLRRNGQGGEVTVDPRGIIRVQRPNAPHPAVSVVVTTWSSSGHLPRLLRSLREQTDYAPLEIIIVRSGPVTPQLRDYLGDLAADPRVRVVDCDGEPGAFAARNLGAGHATGECLLFLSESLEPLDPEWLGELVQWSNCSGIGAVGAKILRADGAIEHAGLVLGLDGIVGPVFAGMPEGQGNIFGGVEWYRNYLAVTGDCLLLRRDLFEELAGFDPQFARYGGDVDLCLRIADRGLRVVFTPFAGLRRVGASPTLEAIADADLVRLHARCRDVLAAGDPYYNPNLSLASPVPRPAGTDEPNSAQSFLERTLARSLETRGAVPSPQPPRPRDPNSLQAEHLVAWLDFTPEQREASEDVHRRHRGRLDIRSINWFIPEFQHAFYGGVYTILRFASYLKRRKGVVNRFYFFGGGDEGRLRSALAQAFPNLYGETVRVVASEEEVPHLEYADAAIATLWTTAYFTLKFNNTRRKFYFIQDCEPMFYPAGATSGLAEATYRFGFYGLANTVGLKEIYEREYGGTADYFTPCVDTELFHPAPRSPGAGAVAGRYRVFFYGRPFSLRNGFELGTAALRRLKGRMGDRVDIVAAGDVWDPADYDLRGVVENLGLLSIGETAALYRTCDAGLVLMFTRHPSYLPFEFMASGCLVVTNRNPGTGWLLRDGENCLLAEPSVECIAEAIERGLGDPALRGRITADALRLVQQAHADWGAEIEKMYAFMCEPDARRADPDIRPLPQPDERIRATG